MTGGPELHGFPPPELLPDLRWLGPDYLSLLVSDLARGLLRQDPGTRLMGVRCEGAPELWTEVDAAGTPRARHVTFPLQVFLQDGAERPWMLRGRWSYVGRELDTREACIDHYWRLLTFEGI
ncbi:hypothetical protein SAMN04489712_103213 [Thermomonospora echinospora]|uniref:Uncharacterized protein n=1 Tax=Thermomonospora echinospora TaxID=1992 RepID=A0A1H5XF54_9ACTN|nr:hypothetical protein [Thermomonospora echinospora]SEG09987.1 hypothetical protein SAMN04489712_103213 [Thermomonospora echinospora]